MPLPVLEERSGRPLLPLAASGKAQPCFNRTGERGIFLDSQPLATVLEFGLNHSRFAEVDQLVA
jgi:hypothetical protein